MPNLSTHCAISKKRTGYDFRDLHEWIDAPKGELGYNHRIQRHLYNETEEAEIRKTWDAKKGLGWGQKAVVEWLFHISLDHLQTAFKKSREIYGDNTFNYIAFGLSKTNFVHLDHDIYTEYELEKYFRNLEKPPLIPFLWEAIKDHFRKR